MMALAVKRFDLGGPRDWDVFSFAFVILELGPLMCFFDLGAGNTLLVYTIVMGLRLIHSILLFMINATASISTRRYAPFYDRTIRSRGGLYAAPIHLSQYHNQQWQRNSLIEVWCRYTKEFPSNNRGHQNNINNLAQRLPEKSTALSPAFPQAQNNFGSVYAEHRSIRISGNCIYKGARV